MTRPRLSALLPTAVLASLALVAALTPALALSSAPEGRRTVRFGGVEVQVPADWPVVDLSRARTGCVRLDRNAVYLGSPALSDCPAHLVGGAQTVQIAFTPALLAPHERGRNAYGLAWERTGADGAPGTLQVEGDAGHASVTITAAATDAGTRALADSVRHVQPVASPAAALTPAAVVTSTGGTYTTGGGFDACSAPSVQTMKAWLASPYRTVGIYVGGVNRGCSQPNLTASWVTTVNGMGWSFIPTYVGLQAPCWSRTGSKIDPSKAASQGAAAASDAANVMKALGLGPGNPVYYDMEAYSTSNSTCVAAVETFVDAWTQRLHVLGYVSGYYSSAASGITNMVQKSSDPSYHLPDDIWFAHWDGKNSVYGDPYVPDSLWSHHQRIKQYHGGSNPDGTPYTETYGGVTINIDKDAVDAATGPWGAHRVPSDVNGDGRSDLCVATGVNGYPTPSGKLELHCLNGASRYVTRLYDVATAYRYLRTRYKLPIPMDQDGDGRTDLCLLTGLNGEGTGTGKAEVHCADASRLFAVSRLDVATAWPYLNTHVAYPLALDTDGDGRTDLCTFTGIDGHTTASGKLELHCLSGASQYSAAVVDAVTPFGYVNTWSSLPIGLDVDADGRTDACLLTGINGRGTPSGRLEVSCALASSGFSGAVFRVSTGSAYLDTRYEYPLGLDANGDGRTDLCVARGLNRRTTSTGKLELRCLGGAGSFSSTLLYGATGFGYLTTPANAFLANAPLDVDLTPPTVSLGGLPTYSLGRPLRFGFGATDPGSGVASYDVRVRAAPFNRGFGAYSLPTSWQATTATAVTLNPVRGATYCLSVRARDHLRNVSAWSSERCTAVPLDDRALSASSGWLQASSPTYYAGTISRSTSVGRTLTRTSVQAHRVSLVVTTCPTCGTVGVYWNGVLLKRLALGSSTAVSQRLVGVTVFRGVASGTLVIRSLTSGPVFVDGLALSRT